jgi:hypothetical protein
MVNDIKKFCETDSGTNLLSQSDYLSDSQRTIGNQPGIARDKLVNKVLRQCSFVSSTFADYVVQQLGVSVLDDSDTATFLANITTAFATGVPVGAMLKMTTPTVPQGFLKMNGAAISRTTYSSLFNVLVTTPGFSAVNFTVSIATPAVVTKATHGFLGGERLRLTTTGTLPTGLGLLTDYFVFYIDANTFKLQTMTDVLSGTFVNTSGSQGGTHSYRQSYWGLGDGTNTFNVPDMRGVFDRAWDDSRGIDTSRVIATLQRDATKKNGLALTDPGHTHIYYMYGGAGGSVNLIQGATANLASQNSAGSTSNVGTGVTLGTGDVETRPINYALMPIIKY